MTRPPFFLLCSGLLLSACGGGDGDADPDDAGVGEDAAVSPDGSAPDGSAPDAFVPDMGIELDPASYRVAYVEMLCRSYFECFNRHTAPLQSYVSGFTSIEECTASTRIQLFMRSLMPLPESIADGHVAFDAESAVACIEAQATYYCDETETLPRVNADPCENVWEGLRESGETCRENECAFGFSCTTGGDCHGTCNPVMLICPPCEAGEYCSGFGGSCEPLLAAGETCASSAMCRDGLVCDAPSMGTGPCVAAGSRSEGEACEKSDVCGEGLYCDSNQCTAYAIVGEGESCGAAAGCEPELFCLDTTSICEQPGGVGEACVDSIGDCGADLYCDPATDLCAAQKANGTSCDGNFECLSFYCPSGTMECSAPPVCEIP